MKYFIKSLYRIINWQMQRLRTVSVRLQFKKIGKDVFISPSTKFSGCKNIEVGNNVIFNAESDIRGAGGLSIGNNCMIGSQCIILTTSHRYKDADMLPFDYKKYCRPVTIGNNVWIGMRVSINPGVKISDGAIVGLGAVVVKDIPPLGIVGGNPAELIGFRDKKEYNDILKDNNKRYRNLPFMKIELIDDFKNIEKNT